MNKEYQRRRDNIAAQFRAQQGHVVLDKATSNLFRARKPTQAARLDVRNLNHVLSIDEKKLTLDVEGMTTYDDITKATLAHGLMPPVVPQLKTITIGGGVSGLAIESSSYREGLTHETILEMDILTADGTVTTCSPTQNADLFYAIPNSYGTLGYILRLTLPLRPVKPYVALCHVRFDDHSSHQKALEAACLSGEYAGKPFDFIDATVFDEHEMYITFGQLVDTAPYTSDYTYERMYFRSIRERTEDYLTIYDYLWRWDTDWFWCSKNVGAQQPLLRRLLGRKRLGSATYQKLMRFEARHGWLRQAQELTHTYKPVEVVIQDVQVPVERVAEFMEFFHREIGIKPVWMCPTRTTNNKGAWPWPLYPMQADQLYVNVGFWDAVPTRYGENSGHYNRLIEKKLMEIDGKKGLYSDAYYSRAEFDRLYNGDAYRALKKQFDPSGRFKDLYQKCVQKQ
ncbi:MAG: FAD-binding oxidoreductase [Candidatus Saccharimonadales bacterium]